MEIIDGIYKIEDIKLGSGSFSDVFLGRNILNNQLVAIKKILLKNLKIKMGSGQNILNKLSIEIDMMQQLDHPNIVKYYDVVKTEECWYIIMEYCNAGTFDDVIKYHEMIHTKSLTFNREASTYYYMSQLKDALNYIRKKGYIHRDIKPMNILLTEQNNFLSYSSSSFNPDGTHHKKKSAKNLTMDVEDNKSKDKISDWHYYQNLIVKLADFGLARHYLENEETLMDTICGSPLYMAPELLIDMHYNSKADLWSYGVVMYEMLFGIPPNTGTSIMQLKKNLQNKKIDFHLNKNLTPECFDLLINLLNKDYKKRIDWTNFCNHKWFFCWSNFDIREKEIKIYQNQTNNVKPKIENQKVDEIKTAIKTEPINYNPLISQNKFSLELSNYLIDIPIISKNTSNLSKMVISDYQLYSVPANENKNTLDHSDDSNNSDNSNNSNNSSDDLQFKNSDDSQDSTCHLTYGSNLGIIPSESPPFYDHFNYHNVTQNKSPTNQIHYTSEKIMNLSPTKISNLSQIDIQDFILINPNDILDNKSPTNKSSTNKSPTNKSPTNKSIPIPIKYKKSYTPSAMSFISSPISYISGVFGRNNTN